MSKNRSIEVTTFHSHEIIERKIYLVRGKKVMFDRDLAELYGVTTGNLNKAVTRNLERFPQDFMFQLTPKEFKNLIFQFGTSRWGGTRKLPRAFTEHGILSLSSVLKSHRAIQVNIAVMRTFVRLRQILSNHKELAHKLEQLERKIEKHDEDIHAIFDAIRELLEPPQSGLKKQIGFRAT